MNAIIETRDLAKQYGDVKAVYGLCLRVDRGEIYTFLVLSAGSAHEAHHSGQIDYLKGLQAG